MRTIILDNFFENLTAKIMDANLTLSDEIFNKIKMADKTDEFLNYILKNCELAKSKKLPICQDTGIVEIFIKIGRNVFLDFENSRFEDLHDFVNSAVKIAYKQGYFRASVVSAILRKNNGENIPAVVHTEFTSGENVEFWIVPKGFGSENMTILKMFNPTIGVSGIIDFIVESVKNAGPNPCPPIFLGIGIGGTSEKAVLLAKKAQIGMIENVYSDSDEIKVIENIKLEILEKVNKLGIGAFGLGGDVSAFDVNINVYPTHIAGLPVAVSFGCWCNRVKKLVI